LKELPKGWERATVGQLGDYWNGRGFKKSEWRESGRPIIRIQNLTGSGASFNYFQGEADDRHIARHGDLLVSWAATLGVYEWKGPEAVVNQHIFKVESRIDKKLHRYLLDHILKDLQAKTHGSGMVHITRNRFDETQVIVPSSNDEQQRIVEVIEEQFSRLDAGVESLQRAKRNLTRLRASLLSAAVEGRLIPSDATSPPAVEEATQIASDEAGVVVVPAGWSLVRLGSIASMSLGKMLDHKRQTGAHPVRYLRNVNVRWFGFDLSDLALMDVAPSEFERVSVQSGDLVVCEGGEPGRCAVWRGDPVAIQKALHRVRPVEGVLAEYLAIVLRWWVDRTEMERFITGTTIKHVPKEKLRLLPIPLPPADEQGRIVAEVERQFSILDAMAKTIDAGLQRAGALRRSILSQAFSGRLTGAA